MKLETPFDVDREIARLAALPPAQRRHAFFAAVDALEPFSRERIELVMFGRDRLAPGALTPAEYNILKAVPNAQTRELSAEEHAAFGDHEAALAVVAELRAAHSERREDVRKAEEAVARLESAHGDAGDRSLLPRLSAARDAAAEARATLQAAWEELEDAMAHEVSLRPHNVKSPASRPRMGRGRNWLRSLGRLPGSQTGGQA